LPGFLADAVVFAWVLGADFFGAHFLAEHFGFGSGGWKLMGI
jgi:hypothetical protein